MSEETKEKPMDVIDSNALLDALNSATAASYDPTGNDDDEIIVTLHFPKDKENEALLVFEKGI